MLLLRAVLRVPVGDLFRKYMFPFNWDGDVAVSVFVPLMAGHIVAKKHNRLC